MNKLIEQLMFEEGLRLSVYHCTANKRTIGFGHNLDANPFFPGTKERIPDKITQEQAITLMDHDVSNVMHNLQEHWPYVKTLSLPRQDACYNMAFQLGCRSFMKFTGMIASIHRGNWEAARECALNSKWARQTPARALRVTSQFLSNKHYEIPK